MTIELNRSANILDTKYGCNWYNIIRKIRSDYKDATGCEPTIQNVMDRDITLEKSIKSKKLEPEHVIRAVLDILYISDMFIALNRKCE